MKNLATRLIEMVTEVKGRFGDGIRFIHETVVGMPERVENTRILPSIEEVYGPTPSDYIEHLAELGRVKITWHAIESEPGHLWQFDGQVSLSHHQEAEAALELVEMVKEGKRKGTRRDMWIMKYAPEGYLWVGQMGITSILLRYEEGSHALYMLYDPHTGPTRLFTKLDAFVEMAVLARGLEEFPLFLTEEWPAFMDPFRYSGFFEKIERHFPETDVSGFRHRDRCKFEDSVVLRDGRLEYANRIKSAFEKMPEGASFRRWHPESDVLVFPHSLMIVVAYQLDFGVKLSDEMEAYYTASQKLEVCWLIKGSVKARFDIGRINDMLRENHAPQYYGLPPDDEPHLAGKYVFYTDQYNDMLVQFEGDGRCTFHLLYLEADDYATHYITDDFEWLFTQLLNARGMYWWNYFLVFEPSAGDQRYQQFHRQMREYFPDADMSLYPDPAGL